MIRMVMQVIAVLVIIGATLTSTNSTHATTRNHLPTDNCVHLYKDENFSPEPGWVICENSISFPSVAWEWNDSISSIFVPAGKRMTVYEHASYGGKCRRVRGGEPQANLGAIGANDQISSFMVNPSEFRWLRCV